MNDAYVEGNYGDINFLLDIYANLDNYSIKYDPATVENIETNNVKWIDYDYKKYVFVKGITYVYNGKVNGRYVATRIDRSGHNCKLHIGQHTSTNTTSISHGPLYDVAIMNSLAPLTINDRKNHVILPVLMFDIEYKDIPSEIRDHIDSDDNIKYYCTITEDYDMTLREFLPSIKDDSDKLRGLLFQILNTLELINSTIGNFRHNNFGLDAIKIVKKSHKYIDDGNRFNVPVSDFTVKIGDFMNANSEGLGDNNDGFDEPEYTQYYDIHRILNELVLTLDTKDNDLLTFYAYVVPEDLRVNDVKRLQTVPSLDLSVDGYRNMNTERTIPYMLMKKSQYFKNYFGDLHSEGGSVYSDDDDVYSDDDDSVFDSDIFSSDDVVNDNADNMVEITTRKGEYVNNYSPYYSSGGMSNDVSDFSENEEDIVTDVSITDNDDVLFLGRNVNDMDLINKNSGNSINMSTSESVSVTPSEPSESNNVMSSAMESESIDSEAFNDLSTLANTATYKKYFNEHNLMGGESEASDVDDSESATSSVEEVDTDELESMINGSSVNKTTSDSPNADDGSSTSSAHDITEDNVESEESSSFDIGSDIGDTEIENTKLYKNIIGSLNGGMTGGKSSKKSGKKSNKKSGKKSSRSRKSNRSHKSRKSRRSRRSRTRRKEFDYSEGYEPTNEHEQNLVANLPEGTSVGHVLADDNSYGDMGMTGNPMDMQFMQNGDVGMMGNPNVMGNPGMGYVQGGNFDLDIGNIDFVNMQSAMPQEMSMMSQGMSQGMPQMSQMSMMSQLQGQPMQGQPMQAMPMGMPDMGMQSHMMDQQMLQGGMEMVNPALYPIEQPMQNVQHDGIAPFNQQMMTDMNMNPQMMGGGKKKKYRLKNVNDETFFQ